MSSRTAELIGLEAERAELQAVLASQLFTRSPTLAHLLSYLCEKRFSGESSHIKEYSVALDVFHRPESFDQDTDSIVRVQANRLRKRLAEYYATEGASHRFRISIPIGQYVPVFEPIESARAPAVDRPRETKFSTYQVRLMVAVVALIALGTTVFFVRRQSGRSQVSSSAQAREGPPEPPVGLPVGDETRILAGASKSYVDRAGKLWTADAYFSGGTPVRSSVQHIWRTQDLTIYRTSRQGDFTYDIPLKPGTYELHLHFAETFYGPEDVGGGGEGSRIMAVSMNGKPLLSGFDVLADSGAGRTADVKVLTDVAPASDGKLHLGFSSVNGGRAMVSAIEVLPGTHKHIRPVRVLARDVPYYSNDSHWWSPDVYFKGGQLGASEEAATGTDDPEFYETQRWGHFSYAVPVAPGKYTVVLYFIDRRSDAANRDRYLSEGPNSDAPSAGREFSVYCNGKAIVQDLNVLEEAGEDRPLIRRISGLEPNAQGNLLLEFVPTKRYATITAIEVVSQ